MPHHYPMLETCALPEHCPYWHPPVLPEVTHVNDPALSIMVDFHYHTPPLISSESGLDQAKTEMQLYHLPLLLVIDKQRMIIGIVASEDILGEKPVKISREKRIPHSEIEVGMVMTPLSGLIAIDKEELIHARVGHIIQTLRSTKQHTLAVVQKTVTGHPYPVKLRGLFSASLISKQLDRDITSILSDIQPITELQAHTAS